MGSEIAMGLSRKQALKRIAGLAAQVEEHLTKIDENPNSRELPHWSHEVRIWIGQIESLIDNIGSKTETQWRAKIDTWREQLGE